MGDNLLFQGIKIFVTGNVDQKVCFLMKIGNHEKFWLHRLEMTSHIVGSREVRMRMVSVILWIF